MSTTKWNAEVRPYKVGKGRRIADYGSVRARYSAGETCQEIADSLGVSRNRINQITTDISRPAARTPVESLKAEKHIKFVIKAIQGGESMVSVCRRLKLSSSQVGKIVSTRDIRPPKWTIHGTVQSYHRGCRCDGCRTAYVDYARNRRQERRKGKTQ